MRILGGSHKGKTWKVPESLPLRPTTSFALEGLMNILHHRFNPEGKKVLDLFSGTGQITLELASRGANMVVSVDKNIKTCSIIQKTAMEWNLPVTVIKTDVFQFIQYPPDKPFDLIFADPPYDLNNIELIPEKILGGRWLNEGGWFILEHSAKKDFSNFNQFLEKRKYGHVCFSIFENGRND